MIGTEMTDAEVADQIDRADRFIEQLREMIAATDVDPASTCADEQRRGLRGIAKTLDAPLHPFDHSRSFLHASEKRD